MIATLPENRYDFYSDPNYENIKHNVLEEMNKINSALGFYNVYSRTELLTQLWFYQYAVLFIGIIFDLLLIIFGVVSILLIYSILMISLETKIFHIGVMRLIGLTES